jgi:hypothetical protein
MKKYGLALLLCFGFAAVFVSAQEPQAILRELSGAVEVKTPGAANWTAATKGMRLEKSASISTGIRSAAVIALGNSVITVRPLTRLSLEELILRENTEQVDVYVRSGRVRSDVAPPSDGKVQFTVHSPSATASVRGTGFDFDGQNISVTSGTVSLSGRDGVSAPVRAGESSYVSARSGAAQNAALVTAGRLSPPALAGDAGIPQIPSGDTTDSLSILLGW